MASVHFTPNLARHTECPAMSLEVATIADLFARYFEQWPQVRGFVLDDQGEVRKHVKVLVDGHNLRDRSRTPISPSDFEMASAFTENVGVTPLTPASFLRLRSRRPDVSH
jgi:hypothetical protein